MDEADDTRQRLREAAQRRRDAKATWSTATDDLTRGVTAARDAGVPIAEVARLAGISRQAVYDILRKRPSQK